MAPKIVMCSVGNVSHHAWRVGGFVSRWVEFMVSILESLASCETVSALWAEGRDLGIPPHERIFNLLSTDAILAQALSGIRYYRSRSPRPPLPYCSRGSRLFPLGNFRMRRASWGAHRGLVLLKVSFLVWFVRSSLELWAPSVARARSKVN